MVPTGWVNRSDRSWSNRTDETGVVVGSFIFFELQNIYCKFCKLYVYILNWVCTTYCFLFIEYVFSSNIPCLYHLRLPSRGTTGDVSIGPWVEKESPN